MIKGRDIILFLAVKYQGDWNSIYDAIKRKELVDESRINETIASITTRTITIIDDEYPESLKKIYKPPFVLFYNGELETLRRRPNVGIFCESKPTQYTFETLNEVIDKERMTLVTHLESSITHMLSQENTFQNRVYVSSTGVLPKAKEKNELYISEYPINSAANDEHINWTARLIVGLSDALLVPQAKLKGDKTMVAAGYAAYLSKPIATLAQKANDGTTKLVAEGLAKIVNTKQSIMELIMNSEENNDIKKDESLLEGNPVA